MTKAPGRLAWGFFVGWGLEMACFEYQKLVLANEIGHKQLLKM